MQTSDCAFSVVRADSPLMRDHVHRLRYQAYCIENPFEDPASHPSGRERDEFDERAVHSLIVRTTCGTAVGSVRLVLPDSDLSVSRLPIQQVCQSLPILQSLYAAGHRVGEVSRFCLSRQALSQVKPNPNGGYRAGQPEPQVPDGVTATLTLLSAVVAMAAAHEVTHICALMAPTLLRLFARFGLQLAHLGSPVEHHGRRLPVFRDLGDLLAGAYRQRPDAWALITQNGTLWPPPQETSAPLEAFA